MNSELLYRIALSRVPRIGPVHTRMLIQRYGTARDVFTAPHRHLEKMEGMGPVRAGSIRQFRDFASCEKEIVFLEKYGIRALYFTDPDYPQRLQHASDSPCLLYFKGNANLNHPKILSVVGTRKNSVYGRWACEWFIEELRTLDILVVSGLAYGIDGIAHKTALGLGLQTIAVLAHGLDSIYPDAHRGMARQMVEQGGLLTDLGMGIKPDKQNFPKRNRITAALCDALLVVESGEKGGSLITASLAADYNRDVFAIPGRLNDPQSAGCNLLIAQQSAQMVTSPRELALAMNWIRKETSQKKSSQASLFPDCSPDARAMLHILDAHGLQTIDSLSELSRETPGKLAGILLELEMLGLICSLPGKQYGLAR